MQAYLEVAPMLATQTDYGPVLRQHLLEVKLRHWDHSLRVLASQGLARLVSMDPIYFVTTAVDFLLPLWTDPDLEVWTHECCNGYFSLIGAP